MKIGWIGTGVMGAAMAGRLLAAGHALAVYNRSRERAKELLERGAAWKETPAAVAAASDVVFTMVGYPHDVEEVILAERGCLAGLGKGGIVCDMTTSSPALARRIAAAAKARGASALDAPVSGGDTGAREGTLSIFVGGDEEAFARLQPLFAVLGQKIHYFGGPGQGQAAKLANQIAVAGAMFGAAESLLFAREAGLDLAAWRELAGSGAGGSAALNGLGPRMLAHDWKPGFFIDHFVKDLGLCLEECRRMGLVLPGMALADALYRSLQAQGRGREGTQALIKGLAALSGKPWDGGEGGGERR